MASDDRTPPKLTAPRLLIARDGPDGELEVIASQQHSVFSAAQVAEAGLTARQARHRVESGRWLVAAPGVYCFPGYRPTWRWRLWVAFLHAGPDSVISHTSAGRLHRCSALIGWPVEVMVRQADRHALPGTVRHRIDDLEPGDIVHVDGLPVTSPARTIVDLAAGATVARLTRTLEDAIVEGSVRAEEVAIVLQRVRRRGKPGVRTLCDVLDRLGPGDGLSRSELERMLDHVVDLAGLPEPVREHPLPSDGSMRGFVDRCWPAARLIVEADGRKWHSRRQEIARDHDRDTEAARRGYLTLRMMWERLQHDPLGSGRALREVYDLRAAAA